MMDAEPHQSSKFSLIFERIGLDFLKSPLMQVHIPCLWYSLPITAQQALRENKEDEEFGSKMTVTSLTVALSWIFKGIFAQKQGHFLKLSQL